MDRNHDDLAGRFLELASAWTPAGRRDWTRAMLAELDQITGTGARWRFAIGAAQVALIPPASGRLAAVVLAALATAAAAIIHVMLPGSGPLAAIVIPGLPALGGWFALARPHPSRQVSVIGGAVQVIAVAGVMACVVLLLRQSVLYPGQSGNSGAWIGQVMTVIFAAGPATYLLLILRRPGPLGSGRHSGLLGLIAASITGVVFLISQPPGGMSDNRAFHYAVWGAMVGAPIAAGLLAAIAARGRRADQWADQRARQWAGVAEMVWGWLLTGPAMFIVLLLTTSRGAIVAEARLPATIEEAHQQGATSITAWVAQDDLGGAMVIFTFLCFLAVMAFAVTYTMYRWGTPGEGSQASRSATNGPADT